MKGVKIFCYQCLISSQAPHVCIISHPAILHCRLVPLTLTEGGRNLHIHPYACSETCHLSTVSAPVKVSCPQSVQTLRDYWLSPPANLSLHCLSLIACAHHPFFLFFGHLYLSLCQTPWWQRPKIMPCLWDWPYICPWTIIADNLLRPCANW